MNDNKVNWRRIREWISRCLSYLFHPTKPKILAYVIVLAATGLILWRWLGNPPFNFYCWNGVGSQPLGTILSALITVLATVSALVISLMFITAQLSASAYTPRVNRVHFFSLHFLGLVAIFLATILFLSWRLGQAQDWAQAPCQWTETAFTLFFACLLFLIPYIWISLRLLQPKHLFGRLMWAITENDFRKASEGVRKAREDLDEKLQPVIDIIRRAARDGQLRTVEDAFQAIAARIGQLERQQKDEKLSEGICATLAEKLEEIGLFANSLHCFDVTNKLLSLTSEVTSFYEGRRLRTGILKFEEMLNHLLYDWNKKHLSTEFPLQYVEGLDYFARTFSDLANVSERRANEYLQRAINAYQESLKIYRKEDFEFEYAMAHHNLGLLHIDLAKVSKGEFLKKHLVIAQKMFKSAQSIYTTDSFPQEYAKALISLGMVYGLLANISDSEEKDKLLTEAYDVLHEAIKLRSLQESQKDYAGALNNLGNVCLKLAKLSAHPQKYLSEAIDYLQSATKLLTRGKEHIMAQSNLGISYRHLAQVSKKTQRFDVLLQAKEAMTKALNASSRKEYPFEYAMVNVNLGNIYRDIASTSEKTEKPGYLEKAVKCFENGIEVYSKESFTERHAIAQNSLGTTLIELMRICTARIRKKYYLRAKEAFDAAAKVWTEKDFPTDYQGLTKNIAILEARWKRLQEID